MQIYQRNERAEAPNGTSATVQIPVGPFRRQTALFVSAHGSSHYSGNVANAGIVLTIDAAGHIVRDDSFEGESSGIRFHAAASHLLVVEPGVQATISANVAPMGAGGTTRNRDTVVDLHVIGLSA